MSTLRKEIKENNRKVGKEIRVQEVDKMLASMQEGFNFRRKNWRFLPMKDQKRRGIHNDMKQTLDVLGAILKNSDGEYF